MVVISEPSVVGSNKALCFRHHHKDSMTFTEGPSLSLFAPKGRAFRNRANDGMCGYFLPIALGSTTTRPVHQRRRHIAFDGAVCVASVLVLLFLVDDVQGGDSDGIYTDEETLRCQETCRNVDELPMASDESSRLAVDVGRLLKCTEAHFPLSVLNAADAADLDTVEDARVAPRATPWDAFFNVAEGPVDLRCLPRPTQAAAYLGFCVRAAWALGNKSKHVGINSAVPTLTPHLSFASMGRLHRLCALRPEQRTAALVRCASPRITSAAFGPVDAAFRPEAAGLGDAMAMCSFAASCGLDHFDDVCHVLVRPTVRGLIGCGSTDHIQDAATPHVGASMTVRRRSQAEQLRASCLKWWPSIGNATLLDADTRRTASLFRGGSSLDIASPSPGGRSSSSVTATSLDVRNCVAARNKRLLLSAAVRKRQCVLRCEGAVNSGRAAKEEVPRVRHSVPAAAVAGGGNSLHESIANDEDSTMMVFSVM